MKKQLLMLIAIVFTTTFANAQMFEITPNGFISASDASKNYVVKDSLKGDQAELYKASLKYFNGIFSSPKDVISVIENESITLNFIDKYNILFGEKWNVNMTYNFKFKDGKLRIDAPYLNKAYLNDKTISINPINEDGNLPLYKRNGSNEIRGKDGLRAKKLIELNTTKFILTYILSLHTRKSEENW